MKKLFTVSAIKYSPNADFFVHYVASLDKPKTNSVMFMNRANMHRVDRLENVEKCIIFYPEEMELPSRICERNACVPSRDPRLDYCLFFRDNHIRYEPAKESGKMVDGAWIADTAKLGDNVTVMPMAYIGGEVEIGDNVYIGAGTKLVGRVCIASNVCIRENAVIGADGLSTDRDANGHAATMPQFGGVRICEGAQIGAMTVIARGAIDDTVIGERAKIDNSTFISHNVTIGEDTFIVGESIFFGGSSTGAQAFVSGNATVRNKVHIGSKAMVGFGAVVTKNVEDGTTVLGNPAHPKK